jgi:hypothetical protein
MKSFLAPLLFLLFLACSSTENKESGSYTFGHEFDADKYGDIVDKWTDRKVVYSGFYNAFEFNITFLNTEVREAAKRYQATYLQWSQEKLQQEINKALDEANYDTMFFLSFFTPNAKDNNIGKKSTIWNVYLEANGRRYEGTAVKNTDEFPELVRLYPKHNRWSTPYIVKFRVPTTATQSGALKFTLAGPMGQAEVTFPK